MSKVLQEKGFGSLLCSTKANPIDQVKSISTTIEANSCPIRRIGSSQYTCEENKGSYGPQFSEAYSKASQSIPRKKKDPRSFTLPCFINNVCFDNALVDLGASVSVMPLSTYLNLGLGELAHTKLTVELADRTVKYPKGIAKNLLVGIGKFTFPVDFIILDMPEDIKVPLILVRPFLSTARAKIDVYKRKITLKVGEENERALLAQPTTSPQLENKDFQQIDEDEMEELDLRWQRSTTRTGLNTPVKQNEKRAVHTVSTASPVSTARPVSTVRPFAPKIAQTSGAIRPIYPIMDNVRPRCSYSAIKRSYYKKLAFRPIDLKQDVKTFGVQYMTTDRTRALVNTGKGKMDTDLKKSRSNPEISVTGSCSGG
ncbi:hypothetical protein Tco_1346879 [Tanacetum coccineum]